MLHHIDVGLQLTVKQHQPCVQVVGQNSQLKMTPVHLKATRRMGGQSSVIAAFFDQALDSGALVIFIARSRKSILRTDGLFHGSMKVTLDETTSARSTSTTRHYRSWGIARHWIA